jgi:hypothetical protein
MKVVSGYWSLLAGLLTLPCYAFCSYFRLILSLLWKLLKKFNTL